MFCGETVERVLITRFWSPLTSPQLCLSLTNVFILSLSWLCSRHSSISPRLNFYKLCDLLLDSINQLFDFFLLFPWINVVSFSFLPRFLPFSGFFVLPPATLIRFTCKFTFNLCYFQLLYYFT